MPIVAQHALVRSSILGRKYSGPRTKSGLRNHAEIDVPMQLYSTHMLPVAITSLHTHHTFVVLPPIQVLLWLLITLLVSLSTNTPTRDRENKMEREWGKEVEEEDGDEGEEEEDKEKEKVKDEEGEDGEGLFEGDIEISDGMLLEYYNKSMDEVWQKGPYPLNKRAAVSDSIRLWPGGIVPYVVSSYAPESIAKRISSAILHWESNTCLRFAPRTTQKDFVHFTSLTSKCSSNVGRRGGNQTIKIKSTCSFGNVVHEIGHTIGFWHEHSRPDRDSYIRIMSKNIASGKHNNFLMRTHQEVDSLQVGYDYGSIMHYRTTSFSGCRIKITCPTLAIQNTQEYLDQGMPTIGQRNQLSLSDIVQANRMYNCTMIGNLKVYVKYAFDIESQLDKIKYWDRTIDAFVEVSGVDPRGGRHTLRTTIKVNMSYPVWQEWLDFGGKEWRAIEIRVWDATRGKSGTASQNTPPLPLSQPENLQIKVGENKWLSHCININCSSYLVFDYQAIADGNECESDPCKPGGNCTDQLANYSCICRPGYRGRNCEINEGPGHLKVFAREGRRLPRADLSYFVPMRSDPYIEFIAINRENQTLRRTSSVKMDTGYPKWEEWLDFGMDTWRELQVTVWDRDPIKVQFRDIKLDDALSLTESWTITSGEHKWQRLCAVTGCNGAVFFDYYFH